MLGLKTPIEQINSIGKRISPKLKKLGINTAADLLLYFPFRHEDWSQIKTINNISPGINVTTKGIVEIIQNKRSQWKKKLITEAIIADHTGQIKIIWFNQPYLLQNIHLGDEIFISGKTEINNDGLQFVHPNYEKITLYKKNTTHTARIIPVYSLTKNITSKQIRYLINQILPLAQSLNEWLPYDLIKKYHLAGLASAVKEAHFPENKKNLEFALERLKFNELFLLQLRNTLSKISLNRSKAEQIKFFDQETKKFVAQLPFTLTKNQKIAAWEIIKDLEKNIPMNRLLEGDVGSGKTIVACLAILNVILNNRQVAYMAPTEILAKQHFLTISKLFTDYPKKVALLTRTEKILAVGGKITSISNKSSICQAISIGEVDIIIGTHSLIQDKIFFHHLALAIIDEQHRFGVDQRKKLKQKNINTTADGIKSQKNSSSNQLPEIISPHFLSMTATPIPRSLALTIYGDLDLSIITEMPLGRKKIITEIVPPEKRPYKYQFIIEEIKQGHQIFIICPLIDPSDKLGVKAVKEEFEKLKKIFPQFKLGLMHGRLKPPDKEKVMMDFSLNKTAILVSTPVIEVGIDIPNATVMVIESAERFGLSQLHQFRGRVGRNIHQSYCFLFTESDTPDTIRRLQTLVACNNGFELAKRDLSFRGPGEIYGLKQSGFDDTLKIAKLTDYLVIKKSKAVVAEIIAIDPDLKKHPLIMEKLRDFEKNIHLE